MAIWFGCRFLSAVVFVASTSVFAASVLAQTAGDEIIDSHESPGCSAGTRSAAFLHSATEIKLNPFD